MRKIEEIAKDMVEAKTTIGRLVSELEGFRDGAFDTSIAQEDELTIILFGPECEELGRDSLIIAIEDAACLVTAERAEKWIAQLEEAKQAIRRAIEA